MDNKRLNYMLWDKSHYKHDWCLQKVKELRASGEYLAVKTGYSLVEYDSRTGKDEKFSKIYVAEKSYN